MPLVITASQLAEEALRQIGSYSTYDTGPDPEDMDVALRRLDLLMAELMASETLDWLIPEDRTVAIPAGTQSVALSGLLDPLLEHYHNVYLILGTNTEMEIELAPRRRYLEITDKTVLGDPEMVHIDRSAKPVMSIWPVPDRDVTLRLIGQSYSADIARERGRTAHGAPASWQRYLIYLLAEDLGRGPVRRLQAAMVNDLFQRGKMILDRLRTRTRDHQNKPRFTRPYDPMRP